MVEHLQDGVIIEKPAAGSGVEFTRPTAEVAPPLFAGSADTAEQAGATAAQMFQAPEVDAAPQPGKIPLHPASIRLPLSMCGRLAAEATGYSPFSLTDQEMNDLVEIWTACGIETSPMIQAMVATSSLFGVKVGGYLMWKRAGRPALHKVDEAYQKSEVSDELQT